MKKKISQERYVKDCYSAGLWFVGMYMEAFLLRIDEVKDDLLRTKLIDEIYDNGENAFDKFIRNTRTRVNALKRIILSGKVVDALEKVINSTEVARENPSAIIDAKNLLRKIKRGEITISC